MAFYPVIFEYPGTLIVGQGLVAVATLRGRILLSEEGPNRFVAFGVSPGTVAGGGATRGEALNDFKSRYLSALRAVAASISLDSVDTSAEAADQAMKDHLEQSLSVLANTYNAAAAAEWEEARLRVREGQLSMGGMAKAHWDDTRPFITIEHLVTLPVQAPNDLYASAA